MSLTEMTLRGQPRSVIINIDRIWRCPIDCT